MNKQTESWHSTVKFVSDVKQYHEEKFVSFRVREDRLDHFLYEELIEKREFEDLWTLFKQLLTLSHGQASVERGFSVNKEVVDQILRK